MSAAVKKAIVYAIILVGQFVITLFISHVTGVEATNTWLGLLFGNVFMLTFAVIFYDVAKSNRRTQTLMGCIFYFMFLLLILILFFVNIAFFIDTQIPI